jgi:hypothetical protein
VLDTFQGEHLADGRLQQATHVVAADLESSPRDAGHHVIGPAAFIALDRRQEGLGKGEAEVSDKQKIKSPPAWR